MINQLKLPNNGRNTLNCEECGQPILSTFCDYCQQVTVQAFPQMMQIVIKSPEQRRQEFLQNLLMFKLKTQDLFKAQYGELSSQLLDKINEIHTNIEETLETNESRNINILRKLYVASLNQILGKNKLKIQKKKICDFFNVDSSKNCQYDKIIGQHLQLQETRHKDSYTVQECLITAFTKKQNEDLVDQKVINIILEFLDIPLLHPTTISVVLEFEQLRYLNSNMFVIEQILKGLNLNNVYIPKALVELKTHSRIIDFTQLPLQITKINKSGTYDKQMNTSISLTFKSMKNDNKIYKMQIFPGGKIKIAGLLKPYLQSDVQHTVTNIVKMICSSLNQTQIGAIQTPYCKTIMTNYKTTLPVTQDYIIDISSLQQYYEQNTFEFDQICVEYGSRCSQLKIEHHRLYLNLAIQKEQMGFKQQNTKSTSMRSFHRSISFNISMRGIVLIQGADDNLRRTDRMTSLLRALFDRIICKFMIKPKSNNHVDKQIILNQLNILGIHQYVSELTDYEIYLVQQCWLIMHKQGLLQEKGIQNRYKYPALFVLINRTHLQAEHQENPYKCQICVKKCYKQLNITQPFTQTLIDTYLGHISQLDQ